MKLGLGIFKIEFYTGDGSDDADAAERAYDWCKENYEWFNGDERGAPFLLSGNRFEPNESAGRDGTRLDFTYGDIPDNLYWLIRAFHTVKATRLVASIWRDFSESDVDSDSYDEFVFERGKLSRTYYARDFNRSIYPAWHYGHFIDDTGYWETFREIRAAFKNKKTGEVILAGKLTSEKPELYCETVEGTLKIGESSFSLEIGSSERGWIAVDINDDLDETAVVKAFVSILKKAKEYSDTDEADWTFCGFKTQPSFFELYGSNPAIAEYNELDNSGWIQKGKAVPPTNTDSSVVKTVVVNDADEDGCPVFDDDFDFYDLNDAAVVFGDNIKKLSYGCYEDEEGISCSEIKSVRFSKNLETIEEFAFSCCCNLEEIIYDGTMEEWKNLDVDDHAFCSEADSYPFEYVPADVIKCSDGEIPIDKSDEGEFEDEGW